jgi:lipid II:glycine glycyltransferase (peptidoglycan interpeptide bridge formation enzyme)
MINRDEYVQKLKTQLDEWNAEAAKWEAKAKAAEGEAKAEFERQLALFRQRRDEGMRKMVEIQAASGEAWTEMMRGADDAWKRMQEAFNQARSRFGK